MDKIREVYVQVLSYDESIPRMSEWKWSPEKMLSLWTNNPEFVPGIQLYPPPIHFLSLLEQLDIPHSDRAILRR